MHGDTQNPISLTCLAATAFNIEGKSTLFIATHFGVRSLCIQITNIIKYPGISCRITAWSTSDRILRYINDFINMLQALDRFMCSRFDSRTSKRMHDTLA